MEVLRTRKVRLCRDELLVDGLHECLPPPLKRLFKIKTSQIIKRSEGDNLRLPAVEGELLAGRANDGEGLVAGRVLLNPDELQRPALFLLAHLFLVLHVRVKVHENVVKDEHLEK